MELLKKTLGLTQYALVTLSLSLIPATVLKHQTFITKNSIKKLFSI